MRLLIVTQAVDKEDPILGFFHAWLNEFSQQVDDITVICLRKGTYVLPHNVKVFSLGKERGESRIKYILNFYKFIFSKAGTYDSVLVHMNPIYVVLGGFFWRLLGKRIALWYTHKHVDLKLRIANFFTHKIFTASHESFRLPTSKLIVTGHGIDTEFFKPIAYENRVDKEIFKLITIGRIAPVKDYETMFKALALLIEKHKDRMYHLTVIGEPVTPEDQIYKQTIVELAEKLGLKHHIFFIGSMMHQDIVPYLQNSDVFVSMSRTGSLDKAALEAMACGVPVVTSSEGIAGVLEPYKSQLVFPQGNVEACTELIDKFINMSVEDRRSFGMKLRTIVLEQHNLKNLVSKLVNQFN